MDSRIAEVVRKYSVSCGKARLYLAEMAEYESIRYQCITESKESCDAVLGWSCDKLINFADFVYARVELLLSCDGNYKSRDVYRVQRVLKIFSEKLSVSARRDLREAGERFWKIDGQALFPALFILAHKLDCDVFEPLELESLLVRIEEPFMREVGKKEKICLAEAIRRVDNERPEHAERSEILPEYRDAPFLDKVTNSKNKLLPKEVGEFVFHWNMLQNEPSRRRFALAFTAACETLLKALQTFNELASRAVPVEQKKYALMLEASKKKLETLSERQALLQRIFIS